MRISFRNLLRLSLALFFVTSVVINSHGQEESSPEETAKNEEAKETEKKEESKPSQPFKIADGKFVLQAPGEWKKVQPKVRMIEHEFQIPPAEGDKTNGRLTVMAAGGSLQANIDRWIGQFSQPDGSSTKEKTQIKKKTVADTTIHTVKISGTFKDRPRGPFGPVVEKKDYRMLAAIVETKDSGRYYIKLYGPRGTIAKQEQRFQKMLDGLETE